MVGSPGQGGRAKRLDTLHRGGRAFCDSSDAFRLLEKMTESAEDNFMVIYSGGF
jgi:hypothetical protein